MFSLWRLKSFCNETAVVIPPWIDDVETLPHKQDLSNLQHFDCVKLFTLVNCNTVNIITGNDNAFLMCAMEEREGESQDEPHAIFTPWVGWPLWKDRPYMPRLPRFLECKFALDAQLIANKGIALFYSRGFELVK